MKKLLTLAVMVTALVLSSCKYDDDDIWNSVHGLEDRVAKLEELCKQIIELTKRYEKEYLTKKK